MDDALNMLSPLGDVYENFLKGEISFWEARIIDDDGPGYLNCFDENGNVYDYRKSGWFLGRNIYTFSKLINSFGFNQRWFAIVEHGIRAIPFFERSDGWLKNTTDRMGNELIEESYPFATMFLVQGLAEYQKIFLNNPVLLSRKWEGCDNYLEEKKQKLFSLSPIVNGMHDLSVSFMRLMIGENLSDEEIIRYEVDRILNVFPDNDNGLYRSFVPLDGKHSVFEDYMNPGHACEAIGFVLEKAENAAQIRKATELLKLIIGAEDRIEGGYPLNTSFRSEEAERKFHDEDWNGFHVKANDKVWWVQLEILVCLLKAFRVTGDQIFLKAFIRLDEYIKETFWDLENGGIFGFFNEDEKALSRLKGTLSKGCYHSIRCYLQILKLLEK